jgi:hypothetical protein
LVCRKRIDAKVTKKEGRKQDFRHKKYFQHSISSEGIEAIDKEIDQMVYALYGLTEEDIAVVEGR